MQFILPFLSQVNKHLILKHFFSLKEKQLESRYLREKSDLIIQKSQKDIFDFDGTMIKKTKEGNKINEFGDLMNVFCVIPRMNNERIKKQAGAFLIYGLGISSICKLRDLSKYLKKFTFFYSDINIYIEEINKYLEVFEKTEIIQDSLKLINNDSIDQIDHNIKNIINEFEKQIYSSRKIFKDIIAGCKKAINDYSIKQNIIEILSAELWDNRRGIPRLIMKEEVNVVHGKKEEILEELSRIGISEETLFPELEHYAESLKRKAREGKMNSGKKKK